MKSKNLLMLGALFLLPILTFSQSDSLPRFCKAKDFMFEINFNPFGSNGVFSFDNLQTKYWINNNTALRLGLQFDYKNNNTSEEDYKSDAATKPTSIEKSFLFGVKPGIEFRILPNSRISPYWGFEFTYINKTSSAVYEDYDLVYDYNIGDYVAQKVETTIDGAWRKVEMIQIPYYDSWGGTGYRLYPMYNSSYERAYGSYGLNILLGTDVNVYKNLYMGFEIGLGYKMTKYKKVVIEIDEFHGTGPANIENNQQTFPSSKTSDFGFYYNSSIRLGIYF